MNETLKTTLFVAVAAVLAVLAGVFALPKKTTFNLDEMVGKPLFPELTDALKVTQMEILRYDEKTGEVVPFSVRQVNHQWSLPSHDNYPADAKDQVVKAATSLMDLRVIRVASRNASTHAEFGVIEPDVNKLRIGDQGVGEKIVLKNEAGDVLLDLILGREVDAKSGKYYVRRSGQDPVYIVKLNTENLSADFSDWIDKDLMGLKPWDITGLEIFDYVLDLAEGTTNIRGNVSLKYADMGDPDWTLESNQVPIADGSMRERPFPAGKVLNRTKLNECRNAIAEMRIVDVAKKPDGLTADLKVAGNLAFSEEAVKSLQEKGFYLVEFPTEKGTQRVLLSNEGEMRVPTKFGVIYTLRFGNIAGKQAFAEKNVASDTSNINRYLFIMADVNLNAIPKPDLHELPENPAQRAAIEAMNAEAQNAYDTAMKEAQGKADALNARFAQWYYVIPDSVYQKIHFVYEDLFVDPSEEHDHDHCHDHDHDHDHGHAHDHDHDHAHDGHDHDHAHEAEAKADEHAGEAPAQNEPAKTAPVEEATPATEEPAPVEPAATEPKAADAEATTPAEATPAEAESAEAAPAEPASAEATPTEPVSAEAAPTEAKPADVPPTAEEPAAEAPAAETPESAEASAPAEAPAPAETPAPTEAPAPLDVPAESMPEAESVPAI